VPMGAGKSMIATAGTPRKVTRVVTSHRQREGGGFVVRRPLGGEVYQIDPFLMLDHLGPVTFAPGEAIGAPDHPHRGFETVTYALKGSGQHKDSAGNSGTLKEGGVQWMTAGSGVVHAEMPSDEVMKNGGTSEGFQLWVNLPSHMKMTPPKYQDIDPENIPVVEKDNGGVWVKVIAGEALGTKAVIDTHTAITYLDIRLQPGHSLTLPMTAGHNSFVYNYRGVSTVGTTELREGQMGMLGDGDSVTVSSKADDPSGAQVLLIAGEPIGEPVVKHGPFVMNTEAEIRQAIMDYQAGKLGGKIEGAEDRYAATQKAKEAQMKNGTWSRPG